MNDGRVCSLGARGFVAINNADSAWPETFSTSLPDGTYCDVVHGVPSELGGCTGGSYVHLVFTSGRLQFSFILISHWMYAIV